MAELGHCCDRMEGAIRMGAFKITTDEWDIEPEGFWGVGKTYIQTAMKSLSHDVAFATPPFLYCPFCGERLAWMK